jgi:hypothetical protein
MFNILKEHKGFWKTIFKLAKVDLIKTYRGNKRFKLGKDFCSSFFLREPEEES